MAVDDFVDATDGGLRTPDIRDVDGLKERRRTHQDAHKEAATSALDDVRANTMDRIGEELRVHDGLDDTRIDVRRKALGQRSLVMFD